MKTKFTFNVLKALPAFAFCFILFSFPFEVKAQRCTTLTANLTGGSSPICYNTTPAMFTATGSGGNGTYLYSWYKNGVSVGIWTQTYTAPALTANSTIYCAVSSCSQTVNTSTYTVTVYGDLTAGSVGSNQTICYNTSPAAFTQTGAPTGGTGSYTYQWQNTTVSGCASGWAAISGATASTYQAPALTATTCYRRNVTSGSCGTVSSSAITATVYANLTAGSVGSSQSICYNASPAAFTQTSAPTGGTGSYNYQWQNTTVSGCASGWADVSGATATTYQAPALTTTTCYRRNVTSGSCGTVSSFAITVTVYANLTAGSVGSNQSICYNTSPAAFTQTGAPTGGTGTYTYQWQNTTVSGCASGWAAITGATATTYQAPALTATTCYRRNVTSGSCGTVSSSAITVTVYANLTAGSIGNSQSICYNTSPGAFTQTGTPTGGTGSYTYQWQNTTVTGCASGWAAISGATASTYQAPALTATTCYRRNATSSSCGTVSSSAITVTVNSLPTAEAGNNDTINAGDSIQIGSSPVGGYTYLWSPATGLSSTTVANPWAKPIQNTTYHLTVTNTNGCIKVDSVKINIFGTSCENAIQLIPDTFFNPNIFSFYDTVKWFIFTANSTFIIINASAVDSSGSGITSLSLYSGNCNNLYLIKKVSDTLMIIKNDLIVSNSYFIKISKQSFNPTNFSICLKGTKQLDPPIPVFSCQPSICSNLIINGEFNTVGTPPVKPNFFSDYLYWYPPTQSGFILIGNNAAPLNPGCWTGTGYGLNGGNFLACDIFWGNPDYRIWEQNITTGIIPGRDYYFSFWANNLLNPNISVYDDLPLPHLYVKFNGIDYTFNYTVGGNPINDNNIIIPRKPDQWIQICGTWHADPSVINVLFDIFGKSSFNSNGNDVGIDNIEFRLIGVPLIVDAGSDVSICEGGSTPLNATGGNTYLWSPATGLSNPNISNPIASPAVTTTYTVIVTDINNCDSGTDNVIVTVNPNLPASVSITANPSGAICVGTSVTFTATPTNGGTTPVYQWKLNGLNVGTNSTTYTNAALANGNTITCVMTSNATPCLTGSPAASNTVTMTVNPLPIANAGTNIYDVCSGAGVQLNASGGTSYNWSSASSLSQTDISNPVASPTITTTYTVTVTNTNGCSATDDVVISIAPNCDCSSIQITHTDWYNTTMLVDPTILYYLNSDVTVYGNNVVLTDISIIINNGSSITLHDGASLTLDHCHLYACEELWQGIIANGTTTGTLNIIDGSLIEDARTAVTINNVVNPSLIIEGSVFNKNGTGVSIGSYQATSGTYPFSITNTVFTCRDFIPYSSVISWPDPLFLNALDNGGTLQEQYGMGSTIPTTLIGGQPATSGISLNTVGAFSMGYYEVIISGDDPNIYGTTINIFDNLLNGINAVNSNFSSVYNVFQNIIATSSSTYDGYGICATNSSNGTAEYQLIASTFNKFYDCTIGIAVNGYNDIYIGGTNMRSTQMPSSSLPLEGAVGIYITTPFCNAVDIINDTITNMRDGIIFIGDADITGTEQSIGTVTIDDNIIQATLSGNSNDATNEYVYFGIYVSNIINNYLTPIYGNTGAISVDRNHLYQVHNGIFMDNWYYNAVNSQGCNNRAYTTDNYITLRQVQYPNATPQTQFGVLHYYNWCPVITNNNIIGFGNNYDIWWGMCLFNNVPINTQYEQQSITCNKTTNTGTGILFMGDQYYTIFENNKMDYNLLGYVLDGARISTQGNASYGCGNTFTNSVNYKTYTRNVTLGFGPTYSTMFLISQDIPQASENGSSTPPPNDKYFLTNGFQIATNNNTNTCGTLPLNKTLNNGNVDSSTTILSEQINWYERIALDSINYAIFETEQRINAKHNLFRILEIQPSLKNSSSILHNFYVTAKNGNIGELACIENALKKGLYNNASSKINHLTPANAIETNFKDFYTIYLHYKQKTYTANDSITLKTLVMGCIARDGMVVQQARALYGLIYRDFTIHFDDCPQSPTAKSVTQDNTPLINATERSFNLYPNPNNGNMILDYNLGKDEIGEMVIYDISGKMLVSYSLSSEQKTLTISKTGLNSGIYYYSIIVNNVILETRKLVILK